MLLFLVNIPHLSGGLQRSLAYCIAEIPCGGVTCPVCLFQRVPPPRLQVGNAGFHNDSLYRALWPAIPHLTALLSDPEEKTRANAAGALGNLVRNSSVLCRDLIEQGAVRALFESVVSVAGRGPEADGTGRVTSPGAESGQSPLRIALFSIGNMCSHTSCREVLLELDLFKVLQKLQRLGDPVISKYVQRICAKFQEKPAS